MNNRLSSNFMVGLAALLFCSCSTIISEKEADYLHERDFPEADLLLWLPPDAETIILSREPFAVEPKQLSGPAELSASIKQLAVGLIGVVAEGKIYDVLIGRRILYSLEGSRRFRAPESLGMMTYEGCHIMKLESSVDWLHQLLASVADRKANVAGEHLYVFDEDYLGTAWTIFVGIPDNQFVVTATNQDFLTETLKRRNLSESEQLTNTNFPNWEVLDTESSFWATRYYRAETANGDPTSPLSGKQLPGNVPDPQAIGFAFSYDSKSPKDAEVVHFSRDPDALARLREVWSYEGAALKFDFYAEPQYARFRFYDISGTGFQSNWFLAVVNQTLGHGVYY